MERLWSASHLFPVIGGAAVLMWGVAQLGGTPLGWPGSESYEKSDPKPLVIKSEGCSTDTYLDLYGNRHLAFDTEYGLECVVLLTNPYEKPISATIEAELNYLDGKGGKHTRVQASHVMIPEGESRYKTFGFGSEFANENLTVAFSQVLSNE